ncbi:MAG: hypothetical protein HRU25_01805 [Psychrobium sp.]|nr:hypothetical protein [Psychrobium sp.]
MTTKQSDSLLPLIFEQRQQLDDAFSIACVKISVSNAHKLKVQILVLFDWLWHLSPASLDTVIAMSLYQPNDISSLANQAFCRGAIAAKLSQQQLYHATSARSLISGAIVMDISLGLNSNPLAQHIFKRQPLTKEQLYFYRQHPLHSANYLHKLNVVDHNAVLGIIEHQELLDGSGFPKKLRQQSISPLGKILAVISKYVELTATRANRPAFSTHQALSYLAQRQSLYCALILRQLVTAVDKALPGMVTKIDKQKWGFIQAVEPDTQRLSLLLYHEDNGCLTMASQAKTVAIADVEHWQCAANIFSQQKLSALLKEQQIVQREDCSESNSRLKPPPTLTILLKELTLTAPDKDKIKRMLVTLPILEKTLIVCLSSLYPHSQFNDSFHAIKMIGNQQIGPLLSLLALQSQLEQYYFPARFELNQRVKCIVNISRHISQHTHEILPNQLAMFSLLNLAPLYFEGAIHQGHKHKTNSEDNKSNEGIAPMHHAYSLFGLASNAKQQKISLALAQRWQNQNSTLSSMALLHNENIEHQRDEQQMVAAYQLAVLICHHVFDQTELDDARLKIKLQQILRCLKMSNTHLEHLLQLAMSDQPMCELTRRRR